jgi:hypothetical protein
MAKKSVVCIATSRDQAVVIVNRLKAANFSNQDISVLFSDTEATRNFAHEKSTKAPEAAVAGASSGGASLNPKDSSLGGCRTGNMYLRT